jgi:CheY-like chemotaxis protein
MKVLFVDDEPLTVESIADELSDEGYSVEMVATADEARARYQTGEYGLLILDLMMPRGEHFGGVNADPDKQTGFLLYIDIRRTINLHDVPVVILTNYPNDAYKIRADVQDEIEDIQSKARELAIHDGALDILAKDLLPSEIVQRIKTLTGWM